PPAFLQAAGGDAEFGGEDVHGAGGQQPERGPLQTAALRNAVDDLVDRAVAAAGDNQRFAAFGEAGGQAPGFPRSRGLPQFDGGAERADGVDPAGSARASGAGVEDYGNRAMAGRRVHAAGGRSFGLRR